MIARYVICPIALAIFAACQPGEPPDRAAPPAPPADAVGEASAEAAERMADCTNHTWGYRVAYPREWQMNPGDVVPECSLFDPDAIAVEPGTELPLDIAIVIMREPIDFGRVTAEQLGRRERSRDRLTLDGRSAVRLETASTGEAMLPAGIRSYEYVVDLDGASLILATYELGDLPFARKRQVLDEMARSLRFIRR
jgi:hypothetical protein